MPGEMVDIVDAGGRPLGVAGKREAHRLGLWHYTFHCWLYRIAAPSEVRVVLQRRGPRKKVFPGRYDISAAGHYVAGEQAADGLREVAEELGIALDFTGLTDLGTRPEVFEIGDTVIREFCRTYLGRIEQGPRDMRPAAPEVVAVVEIPVLEGLALCEGRVAAAPFAGVRHDAGEWREFEGSLTMGDLVPRDPAYYRDVFRRAYEAT
jgi:isopentenyldiphosphate isomerase